MKMASTRSLAIALVFVGALPLGCLAWGVVGHEIVATIAMVHLHPSTRSTIGRMLPDYAKGHLAPVAAWADRIRIYERWSGPLHYISPLGDSPPNLCSFEEERWRSPRNVLSAIANYTERIADRADDKSADLDLRFLVHFIGDVHQPLHLMERERGGNGDPVLFEGRHMSLHGLWDTQMIARSIRELRNYTQPLPSRQIESALRGSIYDSYVRFILWEGVRLWWRNELKDWLTCPSSIIAETSQHVIFSSQSDSFAPCSFHWAVPTHNLTCAYVFPPDYDPHAMPLRELGGADYYGRIKRDKVLERQLAMGGLRLAATLNTLLASDDDMRTLGSLAPVG